MIVGILGPLQEQRDYANKKSQSRDQESESRRI